MNKNELVRWLKSEKEAALKANAEAFDSRRSNAEKKLYETCGADYLIKSLDELAEKELELIDAFNTCNIDKMEMARYYGHNNARSYVRIVDVKFRSIAGECSTRKYEITKNYDNVILQVKALPLSDAVNWLTELGFTIPKNATPVRKNEITVQINTSYLWLNK